MPVHVFKSSDSGAPVMSGQVSALIGVLDAILVNGYNQQTGVTATQSSGTATYTKTSHGYVVDQVLTISGFTSTDYNITGKVLTVPNANTWTMAVDSGAPGTAVGTGTTIVAPLGWSKPYTGTNKAAFRQKSGTNQFYLRVDDSNAQNAQLRGYESMSDVDTGTNAFPTNAQVTIGSGLYSYKSATADSTARTWRCFSDGKIFYLFTYHGQTAGRANGVAFGDFLSRVPGDAYNTVMIADVTASNNSTGVHGFINTVASAVAMSGHYIARPYGLAAGAIGFSKTSDGSWQNGATQMGAGGPAYPDPITGGMNIAPLRMSEAAVATFRGVLPGWWNILHIRPVSDGDKFTGAAGTEVDGIRFECLSTYNSSSGAFFCIDISGDSWSTPYG
jgi:hypothetical protein